MIHYMLCLKMYVMMADGEETRDICGDVYSLYIIANDRIFVFLFPFLNYGDCCCFLARVTIGLFCLR